MPVTPKTPLRALVPLSLRVLLSPLLLAELLISYDCRSVQSLRAADTAAIGNLTLAAAATILKITMHYNLQQRKQFFIMQQQQQRNMPRDLVKKNLSKTELKRDFLWG